MATARYALCLLPEHMQQCGPLARQAEKSGFDMLGSSTPRASLAMSTSRSRWRR